MAHLPESRSITSRRRAVHPPVSTCGDVVREVAIVRTLTAPVTGVIVVPLHGRVGWCWPVGASTRRLSDNVGQGRAASVGVTPDVLTRLRGCINRSQGGGFPNQVVRPAPRRRTAGGYRRRCC